MTEREQFLSDIIVCAIEGGIGYWSQTLQYQAEDRVIIGSAIGHDPTHAIIIDLEDPRPEQEYTITPSVIEQGIARLLNGNVSYPIAAQELLMAAHEDNDAGMIDADDADAIVQAALLGEIRYG